MTQNFEFFFFHVPQKVTLCSSAPRTEMKYRCNETLF